jgi:hypothetical protein
MVVPRSTMTGWEASDVLVLLVVFEEDAGLGDLRGEQAAG